LRILLDTVTFLWIVADSPSLSDTARQAFQEPTNQVYLSAVSGWEIVVKHSLGKLPLPQSPEHFVPLERERHGIEALPLDEAATLQLGRLPLLHRDPFDRMLACQAIQQRMALMTPDALLQQYPLSILW
jgi:PIN domain nuclease of toxin-antitoxin system